MKNRELDIQHKKIQNLFKETTKATGGDLELLAHWAKYLCILSAGFLENAISEVYIDFVKGKAPQPIANYLNLAQISDSSITSQERSKGSDERSGQIMRLIE